MLGREISQLCAEYTSDARVLLQDLIASCAAEYRADGSGGMSGHEKTRLQLLQERIVALQAVERAQDVRFDEFGCLIWEVEDCTDNSQDKTVVWLDGHSDTVNPLPNAWREQCGVDCFRGIVDAAAVNESFLQRELEYIPPRSEWQHLVFGRGAADQLAGVVTQVIATRVLLALKRKGLPVLRGLRVRAIATVSEEDNDGGTPMFLLRPGGCPTSWLPDAVVLTEATGDTRKGPLGLYRGQRGRCTVQVRIVGKSVHGSMPSLGLNPFEWGAKILQEAAVQALDGATFADHPFLGRGTRTASWGQIITPSDCAVPQEFVFKFDRRLTIGETADGAVNEIERLPSVREGRLKGFVIEVSIPIYEGKTNSGIQLNNRQAYSAWVTPPQHGVIDAGVRAHAAVMPVGTPSCRVDSWVFSTDGVGYVVPESTEWIPASWIKEAGMAFPPMVGIGPGREQHAHRIGEYVDMREVESSAAMLSTFLATYRKSDAHILVNPHFDASAAASFALPASTAQQICDFHKSLKGYAATELRVFERGSSLSSALGVARVLVKLETSRLGLPAYKILGASFATYSELCRRMGRVPTSWSEFPQGLTLCAATDGNHGRAVARMAKLLGYASKIFVPSDMVEARIAAIEGEGATVVKVNGTYDDAVARSSEAASETVVTISDTSWPNYHQVPKEIIQGYSTIFREVESIVPLDTIDYVFSPCGVGALTASACQAFAAAPRTHVVSVEPESADCVFQSVLRGEMTFVPGPHNSIMAGLNCGLPSEVAFPTLKSRLSHCVRVSDALAEESMRLLAAEKIFAGETGAASLAGALAFRKRFAGDETVLIIVTEGVTDPVNFKKIVGAAAAE